MVRGFSNAPNTALRISFTLANEHFFSTFSLRQTTDSLQRESDKVARENEDLTSISQRRQDEINQLHDERKTLVQRLSDADSAKYEALMRSEDVVSKEKTLEFREKRLAEDRQLMEHYMENLRQDLHESNEKASAARREKVEAEARYNELVVESESKIKLLDGKVQALGEDKEHLFAQVEELTERLKNSKDDFTAVEEGYRQEIRSKSKLADLHEGKELFSFFASCICWSSIGSISDSFGFLLKCNIELVSSHSTLKSALHTLRFLQ